MTRPGFRRSSAGGGRTGGHAGAGPIAGAPFTQAQILHLMKSEFSRARRHDYPLACVLMKVDRADSVDPGQREAVRRELARLVAEKTRDHDQLGTVDDDGFLLLLTHTGAEAARTVAERIHRGFAALDLGDGRLSLSVGVAACEDRETLFFDTLLSQAELALEWALDAGGGRIEMFRRTRFVATEPSDEG